MQTKLTLRLDEELVERAKRFAKQTGKSVSQMVADYFSLLEPRARTDEGALTPTVRRLKGVLRDGEIDSEEYRRHLEEKYL